MSNLYLVATPIGNLEDISIRAIRILSEVQLIAAEDTRRTKKLLSAYNIKTPTTSYFEFSKPNKTSYLLSLLSKSDIALVSDAGTPGLNDPGYEIVIEAIKEGHKIIPIPGACAPISALVCSGLPTNVFIYLGYFPRKKNERIKLFNEIFNYPYTLVAMEAPHRLLKTLNDLYYVFGKRRITIARELTKMHEEIFRGDIPEAIQRFSQTKPQGEITIVIEGNHSCKKSFTRQEIYELINDNINRGDSPSIIAKNLSQITDWNKREIYKLTLEIIDSK